MSAAEATAVAPYRLFLVEVVRVTRISPSFVRITFTGEDLDQFGHAGLDQRVKVLLPDPYGELPGLELRSPSWYADWSALPEDRRSPMRTYTVRRLDRGSAELDIDFALHDGPGPASAWARTATPGRRLLVVGPNVAFPGPNQALGWAPPADADDLVLVGDETAVPAIASILESVRASDRVRVFVEVADLADVAALAAPPECVVTAVVGTHDDHGARLIDAVTAEFPGALRRPVEDIDVDADVLWEVPLDDDRRGERYFWLAGEAAMIKRLRRHLVGDVGVDRSAVAFMGYWRQGRTEN